MGAAVSLYGFVKRLLPAMKFVDGDSTEKPMRLGSYGEPWITSASPTDHGYAEEGSMFVATNPTIGTGTLWVAAQTAFSDTAPNFLIQNTDPVKWMFLRYLKMVATAAATGTTSIQYAVKIDSQLRTPTTNNTAIITPVNPNMNMGSLGAAMNIQVQNSATVSVIPAASANARIVARGSLGGLNIIGDEMLIVFGSTDAGAQTATTAAEGAGQPGRRVSSAPAVVIGPGHSAVIYVWLPGSSASPAPEYELCGWMR